jgi:hypothetical protein
VLDLNGNGINTVSAHNGTVFDIDNNGKTEKTATTVDETIKQLSVGYNLGPVTVGASIAKVQDLGNTSGVDGDTFVLQASTRF